MNERMMMGDPRMMPDGQGECVGANLLLNDHIHIKRPMNAFMCWAQIARRRLANEHPELRNTELSKMLGQMWKELDQEQKHPYIKKAEHLRMKHKSQYPNYKYRPKRKRNSKYAIVPSPEILQHSSSQDYKLSHHPTYVCNIVKEENVSSSDTPPQSPDEILQARQKAAGYPQGVPFTYRTPLSTMELLKDAAYQSAGYKYPYYSTADLSHYAREVREDYYQHQLYQHRGEMVQQREMTSPSSVLSPSHFSSNSTVEEELARQQALEAQWNPVQHAKYLQSARPYISPHNQHYTGTTELSKGKESAASLKISSIAFSPPPTPHTPNDNQRACIQYANQ